MSRGNGRSCSLPRATALTSSLDPFGGASTGALGVISRTRLRSAQEVIGRPRRNLRRSAKPGAFPDAGRVSIVVGTLEGFRTSRALAPGGKPPSANAILGSDARVAPLSVTVVLNPRSRANRRDPAMAERLASALGGT